jgi:hypothetical protein
MSQNYNRGLENEYLVPYITFTKDPTGSAISSATLTVSPALPDGTTTIDLTQTFTAFASNKEYTLTPDTTFQVTLTLDGAAGGTGGGGSPALGGKGGKVTGTVLLESGTAYKLIIGGQGGLGGRTSGLVGFGGTGGKGDPTGDPDDIEKYAGDGGGLTGIFKTSVTQANALLIAGGGGGGAGGLSASNVGGVGGGSTGGRGEGNRTGDTGAHGADGGTQTAGGQDSDYTYDAGNIFWGGVGQFDPTGDPDDLAGGGGGGGYYGGGGAYMMNGGWQAAGGGGGSGFISVDSTIVTNAGFGVTANTGAGTVSLTAIASAGSGVTSLEAIATASTGNGYMKYQWYQDGSTLGGITTAYSGVATSKDISIQFSGGGLSREVQYQVGATWVPENPPLIVSHGTPGVGATGVGLGQSITGNAPEGEKLSAIGIVTVSPTITVTLDDVNGQPIGYNTSAYNQPRNISITDSISNGDNGNLAYQWYNSSGPTAIAGATASAYTFTPGYVGVNTYYCVVSYPRDTLVPSVTSDTLTDNATDTTQTIRLEFYPAGAESTTSSSTYKVYSTEVNLADHPNGLKIDMDYARSIITSQNTSMYAWENYYNVSFYAKNDDLTVDLEIAGANGIDDNGGVHRGGYGGWMVLQGTMGQNKEFIGIAATGKVNTQRPATAVYQLGSAIAIVGNGGGGDNAGRGGDGGADGAGENSGGGTAGGVYYQPNTLATEGFLPPSGVLAAGRASRCPKGSSYFQNRYGACETFNTNIMDPDGIDYPEGAGDQLTINRGFKMTNHYLINGEQTSNPLASGKGGSGVMGGNGNADNGGGGGSGYYGGNWTKKASVRGGNDGASRSWTYGTNLTQTVTTDGKNGYIRIFGRGGSTGNNPTVTPDEASIFRGTHQGQQGLWFDLREFSSTQDILIWHNVTSNNSGNYLALYLTGSYSYSYPLRGDSDTYHGNDGAHLLTTFSDSGGGNSWLQGGRAYQFRTHDFSSNSSGVYMGGEDQGGTAGIASGGMWDITVHANQPSNGDNNEGGNADLRVQFAILDARRSN